jgi:hypothetical protein
MDPEIKKLIALTEDNNRMLHRLIRDLRWRRFIMFLKWAVIIGLAVGLFWWLQPFIENIRGTYQSLLSHGDYEKTVAVELPR